MAKTTFIAAGDAFVTKRLPKGDRVVAQVIGRDGDVLDEIYNVI